MVEKPFAPNSHTKVTKVGKLRERRLKDNFTYPIELFQLVKDAGLMINVNYSEPLAERLFRIGFQFAIISEKDSALDLLSYSFNASQRIKKKLEVVISYLAIMATGSRTPDFYEFLFIIHRKINPDSLHVNKSITTLKV